jgi:N-acetyl-anhydromuramyl-L-alanine amidase AmpD
MLCGVNTLAMNINTTKFRLPENKYFHDVIPKEMIVLHFTAGSTASGAFNSWIPQTINIGTPYILDTDGTVYEVFDPKCWAYHLGVTGPKAQNHKHDKRSVPIETVNMGPLKLVGDVLYSWPNNYKQKFCMLSETDKYVKTKFRGFDYYAAFTPAQKVVLPELVKKISVDFNIPIVLPSADKQVAFDLDFFNNWKGVAAHQNFRADKTDIGPAWDWSLLA